MNCKYCGNEMAEGAKFCVKCGAAVDPEKDMVIENDSRSNVRQSVFIAIAVGALVLTMGMVFCLIVLHRGSRGAEQTVVDEEVTENVEEAMDGIITAQDIADADPIRIAGFESINLSRRNHIPGQKISGSDWEDEFFYWFEDTDTLSDENDNYISRCHITHYQMFREDSGRNIEYEVYRDPANDVIYKIVSIERMDDGQYELVDYYYVDGRPYFVFQRYDSVYTPTYATLGKPGMRYYFNDDTMVRCRSVGEDLKVSQTGLLLQEKAGFEEFDYFTAPEAIHDQYEQLEMEWLNKAYNTYDAVRDGTSIGILRGTVRNMAGNALEGYQVYVRNTEDGSIIYQAETDGDGAFRMYVYLDGKDCLLYVAGNDTYEGACVYGVKLEDTSLYYSYDSLIMHSFDYDSYPVTLQLCNAEQLNTEAGIFGGGVTGADIIIRKGVDARQGSSVYEGFSDDSGAAAVDLPSGSYTAEISCEGYATNYINLEVTDTGLSQNIYMIKSPQEGQTVILMTWSSEMDKDLDLTVFTPYQGENGDMAYIGGAVLSDDYGNRILHDNSMGCEIAYVDTTKAGIYKVYVNDYTDSIAGNYDTGIYSELDVHIYIYQPEGYVTEINVPGSARGVVWEAAEISGNRISLSQRMYTEIYGKSWWTTNKHTEQSEKLLDQFLDNELPAILVQESGEYSYYYNNFLEDWADFGFLEGSISRLDLDNDGANELALEGSYYGTTIIDARDNALYILACGEGTAAICSFTFIGDEAWIVHSDTTHQGRQMYHFEKFNGNGEIVEEFDLNAEYWDRGQYDENSDFTYRGKKITMQEFENLRDLYLGY